ncbi:patatin-like phospholipase family protein [Methylobacterium gossipiicola]|uniref:Predicted acylesterase/phospholipase RssA, contains patatin domain n=1 Tax=Methylobacterium gossipiicola TaxID=582675 RepID=A0A1I2TFM9_9HYPH|nr:patatin-like phospholipase family protein [Methylobacterium gossipiicola]SFG61346.1 Predicted acylesterase/phospholipase RssA, contains patatin domain [Methylobacterium gossipiicola]
MSRRLGWSRGVLALLVAGQLGACGSTPRTPYTASEAAAAQVPGMDLSVRAYADASEKTFTEMAARPENRKVPFAYLALSGGGGDGAYGAGILNGWTESGKRPEFSLVSGVSTGALIAPFAFVGPEYDAVLKDIYTSGIASTLVQSPSVTNILFGSGLFGDGRLRDLVRRYVTPDLLAAVAAQHAKGRRLLVVTTNLDSQRAVIWNMGAIAASGSPTALDLFADVLTASASIPAVFPPQLLDVQAEGRAFQEMHVDGSVVTPVFTLPQSFLLRDGRFKAGAKSDIYVIINGRLEPEFDLAQNNTLSIVERSFTTASRARSRATMATTYAFSRANGIGFNLTYIDESAPNTTAARGFDTGYMRGLYEAGYRAGRTGTFWHRNVPTAPLLKTVVSEAR